MVREAEENAAEDERRREEADVRNMAEQQVYSIEKLLTDNADKLDESIVSEVTDAKDELKTALEGTDVEAIKAAQEKLNQVSMKIGEALYAADQAAQAAGASEGAAPSDDDVVDAEIVDDEEK